MKVLFLFRSLAVYGGIERVLIDKMNALVKMYGMDVNMLTTDQGSHPIPYHLEENVRVEDLNINFHQQYQYNVIKRQWVKKLLKQKYEQRLAEKIRQIQPDIIVCTSADHIELLVKLKGSIPLVVESHSICIRTIGDGRCCLQRKWNKYHYMKALPKVDVIVALTEEDANEWRKIHHNVVVIPNIVHLNEGKVSTLGNKRVIWVGRFDYQKCPLEMVRIWKVINTQFPDWQLDMYGEGELRNELENSVRLLDMNITIHQPTERIFECYQESAVFVSTSLFEPFGLVIPEAMSCGLPVVAYDCLYGPRDIIRNGVDGFVIENRDINKFAEKVCLLMGDHDLRVKMGSEGVKSSSQYEDAKIMPKWIQLFKSLKV